MRLVEVRSYKLLAGESEAFHQAVVGSAVPMLRRWNTDVVTFGPGVAEGDTYFLVRAYASLAALQAEQDAFYGSAQWRDGPRQSIVSRIASHLSTVLWLPEAAVEAMRQANPAAMTLSVETQGRAPKPSIERT
jgi:hypothetical protein